MSALRIIAIVCTAQVFAQIGAFAVPALLPVFIERWELSGTEAGWIIGAFYASYTLTVPVLVSLTDRVDPKRVYLGAVLLTAVAALGYATLADGFWSACLFRAVAGIGWAGTYMPGLKALSDFVEGPQQSRGVALHAASIGVSGAASFIVASTIASWFGWRWGLAFGGICALVAFVIMASLVPSRAPRPADGRQAGLLDFRPVLRNRSALAYSLGYCFHTWEMNALRAWVVTFLTFALAASGGESTLLAPAAIATVLSLAGVWASVSGNELARKVGRRRFIVCVMAASMAVATAVGFTSAVSYELAAALCIVYGILIWADSSSLTAGTVGSALPGQRGATMAVHSTLGYGGGFVGPLAMGAILDLAGGGESAFAWGLAFAHIAAVMGLGLLAMIVLRPKDLAGDRSGD